MLSYTAAAVSAKFRKILRKLEIAVQGYPKSSTLVPIESAYYILSYWPKILTLDVSLTRYEILTHLA